MNLSFNKIQSIFGFKNENLLNNIKNLNLNNNYISSETATKIFSNDNFNKLEILYLNNNCIKKKFIK